MVCVLTNRDPGAPVTVVVRIWVEQVGLDVDSEPEYCPFAVPLPVASNSIGMPMQVTCLRPAMLWRVIVKVGHFFRHGPRDNVWIIGVICVDKLVSQAGSYLDAEVIPMSVGAILDKLVDADDITVFQNLRQ